MEAPLNLRRMTSDSAARDTADDVEDEDVDDSISQHDAPAEPKHARTRLFAAFLIFGLLNNVLYVVILSAALDLVPASTPKGIVAFFNIFPALLAKVFWPLVSTGTIQYRRRLLACTAISWLGIVIIALSASVPPRLSGIALASFSSGLGELTFLQLTTTLPGAPSRTALGAWASGTGLAGIAGAGIWWALRGLGVMGGLGISSFLPLFFPITYFYLLPPFSAFPRATEAAYAPLPPVEDVAPHSPLLSPAPTKAAPELRLSHREKLGLLRPLVVRYMLPLAAVYIEEYVINTGVAPVLVFPAPQSGPWSLVFKSPRDFYPFWSLTYQTFVFLSRSSLSLGLPPLPRRLLPLPSASQFLILVLLALQARSGIFSGTGPESAAITPVFVLVCLEGLCGGLAYVNTFFHVGREGAGDEHDEARAGVEREFRVGAVGAADSCGILVASLISMPVEVALCAAQVRQGKPLCRDL